MTRPATISAPRSPKGAAAEPRRPEHRQTCSRAAAPAPEPGMALFAPPTVLILQSVDVNRRILRGALREENYNLIETAHPAEALRLISREQVDLVILDLVLPDIGGPELCRRLKADRRTRFIPLLVMTSLPGADYEIQSIAAGADEFLVRPVRPDVIRTRVRSLLKEKAAIDSLEEAESILFTLAQAIEHRDKGTIGHCERLALLSMRLGAALGLPRPALRALYRGGYLHDIGKIAVPDSILFKPGPLDAGEWEIMKTHTVRGEEICRNARTLGAVLPIIRSHHERWDGTGYPDGLHGQEIPLLARILQVADIYDAMTSERPYKAAWPHAKALEALDEECDKGWRDPELVRLLREVAPGCDEPDLLPRSWPRDGMQQSLENMRRVLLD